MSGRKVESKSRGMGSWDTEYLSDWDFGARVNLLEKKVVGCETIYVLGCKGERLGYRLHGENAEDFEIGGRTR